MRRPPSFPLIEPLESRIAPAAVAPIVLGAGKSVNNPLTFSDTAVNSKTGLVELQFINAANPGSSASNQAIAALVNNNADVYFIKVAANEAVEIPTPTGYQPLVNVTKGTVVAFFTAPDSNASDSVLSTELTGLSLGTKVAVSIGTDVHGDIVTNYNDATSQVVGGALLNNTVTSITLSGNVTGAFISGGTVSKYSESGAVHQMLTGTAAANYTFDFDQGLGMTNATLPSVLGLTPATGVAGPSLNNVTIDSSTLIQLGNGGPGAAGGSLNGLTVLDMNLTNNGDPNSLSIIAGAGGAGIAGKTNGGAGGSISNVVLNGPPTIPAVAPNQLISLQGGAGGAGFGSAKGGAGGPVKNIYVGYLTTNTNNPSATTLQSDFIIQGGAGGTGGSGGAGGSLANVNLLTSTPYGGSGADLQLLGGAGGSIASGAKAGAGGSIANSSVSNIGLPATPFTGSLPDDSVGSSPTNVIMLIQAGAGGVASASGVGGSGGSGGSVSALALKGFNFQVIAGDGGDGISAGGTGGGVGNVKVYGSGSALPGDDFHAESLVIVTGAGGNGVSGHGGSGGSLAGLTVSNADFLQSTIVQAGDLQGTTVTGLLLDTGAGGSAGKSAGGAGGNISNVTITEADFLTVTHPVGNSGAASISAGAGGTAAVAGGKGGAGGSIGNVVIAGARLALEGVTAGAGGSGDSGSAAGKGGAGGKISSVAISTNEGMFGNLTTAGGATVNQSQTTASTGYLYDPTANFGSTGDDVQVNDTVTNPLTGATTTVTGISADGTELTLASDIFAVNDPYNVDGYIGVAGDPATSSVGADNQQDVLTDANANFYADGNILGATVIDAVATPFNGSISATAFVTAILSPTQIEISSDISRAGDSYAIIDPSLNIANFTAGNGGAGAVNGAGGAGGGILNSSAQTLGSVSFTGGTGGPGGSSAAAGAGGTLNGDGAFTTYGSATLQAGNAGGSGAKAGVGGSIVGADIQAIYSVTMIAGNGTAGGAGGSILSSGFYGASDGNGGYIAPIGNITIQAGTGGSSATGNGGAGGSISSITGFISGGDGFDPFTTQYVAGGGGNGLAKAGAGGSVSDIHFFGGGGQGVTFYINAGDAGNASAGKTGAAGGSVVNIGGGAELASSGDPNFSISTLTNFHHISAGDGGNAVAKGGVGGSVTNVHVNAAIGFRTGVPFGFNLSGAGGISAGSGGTGAANGAAGSVTNISADAIASIVAGHMNTGDALQANNLVTKVDGIILNGNMAPSTIQQFELSFGGVNTTELPTNAPAVAVANALNSLKPVEDAGGVTVTNNGTSGYTIYFNNPNAQAPVTGDEPSPAFTTELVAGNSGAQEVQQVQVLAPDPFTLTFDGQTTSQLAANDTAADVQNALNALSSVQAAGGVNVTYVASTGASPGIVTNPGYIITFGNNGGQSLIVPNFTLAAGPATGGSQTLTFPVRGDFEPTEFSTANLVGSIDNILVPSAATFHYTQLVSGTGFQFGDAPIDGLIAALNLTSNKNFVPEAYVTENPSNTALALLVDPITT